MTQTPPTDSADEAKKQSQFNQDLLDINSVVGRHYDETGIAVMSENKANLEGSPGGAGGIGQAPSPFGQRFADRPQ